MSKRIKANYPGVYYREAARIGGNGLEKVFYIVFKKHGKTVEEKVGRQYMDAMTPAKAAHIRAERIEGKRQSRKEQKEAIEAEKKAQEGRWTIERLWQEYLNQKPDLRGYKTDQSRYALYIAPHFGDKEPGEIITLDVDRLRLQLLKKKAPQTVKHVLVLLKRIINFGVRKGLCPKPDPRTFSIEMPPVDNERTEDLSPEQLSRLLDAIEQDPNRQAAHLMKMALFTGMRRGELFKLQWDDIDFERGFILIRNPKGGQDQKIPLNPPARNLLENHPKTDSAFVFPGRGGRQRTDIKHQVNRIKQHAGLPKDFRPLHGLRHVYASMLASSGQVDLYTLQKLLTHKSAAMTERYAHLRDEALKRASDVAGDILEGFTNGKDRVVNLNEHRK